MREDGLQGLRTHRRRIGTTVSDPAAQKAANLLTRTLRLQRLTRVVADVTYVPTAQLALSGGGA